MWLVHSWSFFHDWHLIRSAANTSLILPFLPLLLVTRILLTNSSRSSSPSPSPSYVCFRSTRFCNCWHFVQRWTSTSLATLLSLSTSGCRVQKEEEKSLAKLSSLTFGQREREREAEMRSQHLFSLFFFFSFSFLLATDSSSLASSEQQHLPANIWRKMLPKIRPRFKCFNKRPRTCFFRKMILVLLLSLLSLSFFFFFFSSIDFYFLLTCLPSSSRAVLLALFFFVTHTRFTRAHKFILFYTWIKCFYTGHFTWGDSSYWEVGRTVYTLTLTRNSSHNSTCPVLFALVARLLSFATHNPWRTR